MDDELVEYTCLTHVHYKVMARWGSSPRCNHGIYVRRILKPCNAEMWAQQVLPWADGACE